MSTASHPKGSPTYFASHPSVNPTVGADLDEVFNYIIAKLNALDDENIDGTPAIQGGKIDLSLAGYLLLTGGSLSGAISHIFEGVWRTMRDAGNARVREYNGVDGALWGMSYNTKWNGSAWDGRDVTGICAVLKMESDGLHYYHAVSGAGGVAPTWSELFHLDTSGELAVGVPRAASLNESMIDWANAGGISQTVIMVAGPYSNTGGLVTVEYVALYVPAAANSFEYAFDLKGDSGGSSTGRLINGATIGTTCTAATTSYALYTGTIDVSAMSGWTTFEVQVESGNAVRIIRAASGRFI